MSGARPAQEDAGSDLAPRGQVLFVLLLLAVAVIAAVAVSAWAVREVSLVMRAVDPALSPMTDAGGS